MGLLSEFVKDKIKKEFALSQGYHFLEIPYWSDDKDNTWKQLINNKIQEIKALGEINVSPF